jgi:undecaprenyl-diphosphatase
MTEGGDVPGVAATLILAVVQGLTEFLPVSSSGHLVLFGEAMSVGDAGLLMPVALHLGTLVAVLIVYRRDVRQVALGLFTGAPRDALLVAVATLPAVVVGFGLRDFFAGLFASGRTAAVGLLVTGALLIVADGARRRTLREAASVKGGGRTDLTVTDALLIGIAQAVAIFPGVSRSGSTIAVALLRGIEPLHAARFSFLMSIPAILGAAALEGGAFLETTPSSEGLMLLGWGLLVAALVGWAALRVLIAFLNRGAFAWFSAYCAALGIGYLVFA